MPNPGDLCRLRKLRNGEFRVDHEEPCGRAGQTTNPINGRVLDRYDLEFDRRMEAYR